MISTVIKTKNSFCRKTSISKSIYITLNILLSLISVVTVFLNLLVIISISHFKHLHTPSNLLILSLAVSDLLVGLIVIPLMTVAMIESCWVFGEYFCVLLLYTDFVYASLSLGNLVLMSIDRYVAVCDPLMFHLKITITITIFCVLIVWGCCIIYDAVLIKTYVNIQVPSGCFKECYLLEGHFWFNIFDLLISNVVPCSIIITLYMKIYLVARSQARQVFSTKASCSFGVKSVQAYKSQRKASKTVSIIVFNYLIFWNPFIYILSISSSYKLASFISILPLVNSILNPIIYAFFYPWFKVTAKRILTMNLRPI